MQKHDFFTCDNNMLSSHVKYHRCYGYIINRAFHNSKTIKVKWCGISLVFIVINKTLHGRLEIRNFSSRVEKIFQEWGQRTREIFFNTRREISYLRAAMYFPLNNKKQHGFSVFVLIPNCSFYDEPAMVYDMIHTWSMLSFYVVCFSAGE